MANKPKATILIPDVSEFIECLTKEKNPTIKNIFETVFYYSKNSCSNAVFSVDGQVIECYFAQNTFPTLVQRIDKKNPKKKVTKDLFFALILMVLNDSKVGGSVQNVTDRSDLVRPILKKYDYTKYDLKKILNCFDRVSLENSLSQENNKLANLLFEKFPNNEKNQFSSIQFDSKWNVIDSDDTHFDQIFSKLKEISSPIKKEDICKIFNEFDLEYLKEEYNNDRLKKLKLLISTIHKNSPNLNISLDNNLLLSISKIQSKENISSEVNKKVINIYKEHYLLIFVIECIIFAVCLFFIIPPQKESTFNLLEESPVVQVSTRNTIDTSLITAGRTKINEINCEEKSETDNVNYLTIYALDGVYDNQTHEIGVRLKNKLQEIIKNYDLNFKIFFCNKYRTVSYHNKSHLSNKISNLESKTDFEFYHEYNQGNTGGSVITIHNKPRYYPNEPLVSEDFSAFKYSFIKTSRQANKINITSDIIDERKLEYMAYYFLAHYYDLHLFDKKVYDIHSLKYFKLLIGEIKNKSKNSFTIHDIEQILKYKHNNPQLVLKALTKYYQNAYYREIDIKKFNSLVKKTLENDHFLNIKNINRCVLTSINAFTYQENKELFDFLLRFMSTTYFQFYEDEPTLSNLSNLHTSLYVHCNYLEKGREQLYGNLLQFKEETPKNIVYLNIAYLYYLESKYDQAIDVLKISIHDDNTSFECKRKYLMLSKLYGLIGKPNKSFEYTNLAYKYERPLKSHEEIRELYLNLYNINSYDIYHMSCVYSQKDPFSREALDLINWAIAEQNFSLRGEKSLYINKYFLEQRRRVLKYRNDNGYKADSLKILSLDKFFFKKDSNELIPSFMYEPKPLFYMNNLDGSRFVHNLPKASYHLGLRHYLKFYEYSQL